MDVSSSISLETRILDLPNRGLPGIGAMTARKLAGGIAEISTGKTVNSVTVEDLLLYLPMRYEDRSHLARISDLQDGTEASLELFVKLSGGKQVGGWRRTFRQRLYIFKISATDRERTGKDVLIWTFLSGLSAPKIIDNYEKKFTRGVRFIAFGKWEWDAPNQTYALRLNKPDEIEVLPPLAPSLPTSNGAVSEPGAVATGSEDVADEKDDLSLATIHVGRCVPVYRKISDIRSKQLRELIHRVLSSLPDSTVAETLPKELRQRQRLISRDLALRQIHFPSPDVSLDEYEHARSPAHRRLIFEELFWLGLALASKRGKRIRESKGASIKIDDAIKS